MYNRPSPFLRKILAVCASDDVYSPVAMPPCMGVATNTVGGGTSLVGFCRGPASKSDSESTTGPLYAVVGRSNGWKAPAQDAAARLAIYCPLRRGHGNQSGHRSPDGGGNGRPDRRPPRSHEWLAVERDDETSPGCAQPLKRRVHCGGRLRPESMFMPTITALAAAGASTETTALTLRPNEASNGIHRSRAAGTTSPGCNSSCSGCRPRRSAPPDHVIRRGRASGR